MENSWTVVKPERLCGWLWSLDGNTFVLWKGAILCVFTTTAESFLTLKACFWEFEKQCGSVSSLDQSKAKVTGRREHFPSVRSDSLPAWTHWKTPIRGPAFFPFCMSDHYNPLPAHLHTLHRLSSQPQRSALCLTCSIIGAFDISTYNWLCLY